MQFRLSVALATSLLTAAVLGAHVAGAQDLPSPPAAVGPRPAYEFMQRAWGRMTADDRAALFDAHLAALHVGLKLTADQEKLWPPLETSLRDAAKETLDRRRAFLTEGPPADPVAGLRRAADRLTASGDALRKIADAAQPLFATLNEDQKRRLPILLHGLRPTPVMRPAHFGRGGDQLQADPQIGWGLPE